MRKLMLLIVVLAVIAAGWFLYFNNGETVTMVSFSEVKYMDLQNSLEFSGEVIPEQMYSVMSKTGGTIKKIYVTEGSKVGLGEALFDLDTSEAECLLKEAELNYQVLCDSAAKMAMAQSSTMDLTEEKAKIALALSQTTGYDYESFNRVFSGQISQNVSAIAASLSDMSLNNLIGSGMQQSLSNVQVSDDELALAELSIQRLKQEMENMAYKSLMKGTVISVNINTGEVLSPGIPAMVIADTKNTRICGYIYEKDISALSTGMAVSITTEKGKFKGTLTKIGEAASNIGNTSAYETMAKVEITPDKGFNKMPGAIVDLKIILLQKKNVLALPIDCITEDGYVFVIGENDILEKRAVQKGFEDTFNIEILGGLSAGEKVVLSPQDIKEGLKVAYD
ncbi:MAG: efflux RND transporter periplasmic adaptor subunit [Christensenellales bacterium]|jgi:multidrug efflux pump subunit AcrA (membrane-fusion protein)